MNPFQILTNNDYQQFNCSSSENASIIFLNLLWQYYLTIENTSKNYDSKGFQIEQFQSMLEKQFLQHLESLSAEQINDIVTRINFNPEQFAQTTTMLESLLSVTCLNDHQFWHCPKTNGTHYQIKINESLQILYSLYTVSLICLDNYTDSALNIEYSSPLMIHYEQWHDEEMRLIKQIIIAHVNTINTNNDKGYQAPKSQFNWYTSFYRKIDNLLSNKSLDSTIPKNVSRR